MSSDGSWPMRERHLAARWSRHTCAIQRAISHGGMSGVCDSTSSISGAPSRVQRRSTALTRPAYFARAPVRSAPAAPRDRRRRDRAHPSRESARRQSAARSRVRGESVGTPRSSRRVSRWPSVPSRRSTVATSRRISARSRSLSVLKPGWRRRRRAGRRGCGACAARRRACRPRSGVRRDRALRKVLRIWKLACSSNVSERREQVLAHAIGMRSSVWHAKMPNEVIATDNFTIVMSCCALIPVIIVGEFAMTDESLISRASRGAQEADAGCPARAGRSRSAPQGRRGQRHAASEGFRVRRVRSRPAMAIGSTRASPRIFEARGGHPGSAMCPCRIPRL